MEYPRLNLLITIISCLAVLVFPIFVTGCGDSGDDDSTSGDVVAPDPEPVSKPPPQLEQQPQPEPPPQQQPDPPPLPEPVPGVSFQEEILPILQASCAVPGCHAAADPKAGLNLTTYADFERGGFGGPVFEPGNSKRSGVIRRIDGGGMPPAGPLPKDQIQLFKDWIDEGAKNN